MTVEHAILLYQCEALPSQLKAVKMLQTIKIQ